MADIRIARPHGMPVSRAKAAAQAAADELAKTYSLSSRWQGNILHFRRNGLDGHIEISPSQVALEIRLGILLKGFRRTIEKAIGQRLEQALQAQGIGGQ